MKRLFIALALIATVSLSVKAQEKSKKHQNMEMMKNLNLTADQKTKAKTLRETTSTQIKNIRDDQSLTQDQKKEKIQALVKKQRAAFGDILTADQRATLKKEMAQRREDKKPKDHKKNNSFANLNLTPDQQTKIKVIRDDSHTKLEAVRNDASLTDQQKKDKKDEIFKTQRKSIGQILTADQKATLKKERKENNKG